MPPCQLTQSPQHIARHHPDPVHRIPVVQNQPQVYGREVKKRSMDEWESPQLEYSTALTVPKAVYQQPGVAN